MPPPVGRPVHADSPAWPPPPSGAQRAGDAKPPMPPPVESPPTGVSAAPAYAAYAGWLERVFATLIDAAILFVPFVLVNLLLTPFLGLPIGIALMFGFYLVTMGRQGHRNGQSPGHQALGIRVVRRDGRPIDAGTIALRQTLVQAILFGGLSVVLLYMPALANYLWPIFDRENRALHDMMASTRVVKA